MREVLMGNSDILYSFCGTRELTPDLKHRLGMNRAFGTFLFPNALAAFLILAIPYLLSELWASWHDRASGVEAVEEDGERVVVAVQWHPEVRPDDPEPTCLCEAFVNAARVYASTRLTVTQ